MSPALNAEREAQCRTLWYGTFPSWSEVHARFLMLKDFL